MPNSAQHKLVFHLGFDQSQFAVQLPLAVIVKKLLKISLKSETPAEIQKAIMPSYIEADSQESYYDKPSWEKQNFNITESTLRSLFQFENEEDEVMDVS